MVEKAQKPRPPLKSHREFREAWIKAGCPKNFVWDPENGGRVLDDDEMRLRRKREKVKQYSKATRRPRR